MRSGKPDPLRANVVHVREDRRDGTHLPRRFGCPRGRIEMLDQHLVHSIVRGEDADGEVVSAAGVELEGAAQIDVARLDQKRRLVAPGELKRDQSGQAREEAKP